MEKFKKQFNFLTNIKLLLIALFVIGSFVVFANSASATNWKPNPNQCPTTYNGQIGNPGEVMCGLNSGVAHWYLATTLVTLVPSGNTTVNTGGGTYGGYVVDCDAFDSTAPRCDNTGAFWCSPDATCNSAWRKTECIGTKWATDSGASTCSVCQDNRWDCDANNTCETADGASCTASLGGNNVPGTMNCVTGAGSCSDLGSTSATCTCVPGVQYFQTGIQAQFSTTSPLLWGTQYGTGDLINISSNDLSTTTFMVSNSGQVGVGLASAINTNVAFEVSSTNRGVLLPRLTDAQKSAILTPPEGLLIYNIDNHVFEYYATSSWLAMGVGSGGGTPAGTDGQIQFNDSGAFGATNTFYWDNAIGSLSVGDNYTWLSGSWSFVQGLYSQATGTNSIAMGQYAQATNNFAVAIGGSSPVASGYSAIAMGSGAHAYGNNSIALGNLSSAENLYSVAIGYQTRSAGNYAVAIGGNTRATGLFSVAIGNNSTSSGNSSFVGGYNNNSSGNYSAVFGSNNINTGGDYAFISGDNNVNSGGLYSAIFGAYNTSTGQYSFIGAGLNSVASGLHSVAFGRNLTVSGNYSFGVNAHGSNSYTLSQANTVALMGGNVGVGTTTPAYRLTVSGDFAVTGTIRVGNAMTPGTYGQLLMSTGTGAVWMSTSSLGLGGGGVTGSGTSTEVAFWSGTNSLSSSSSLYWNNTNGRLGINNATPEFSLTLGNDGGIIATGTVGSGATLSTAGAGARMIWYPRKAAFRAGYVNGTQWNDANIGENSVAMGNGSRASGYGDIAIGTGVVASGGNSATAIGALNTASGDGAIALGRSMTVSGNYSFGVNVSTTGATLSQASTIALMGGNVGVGTTSPLFKLTIDGGIYSTGTFNAGETLSYSGAGTRMIWYPRKAAFRAGNVDSTQWNDANIGTYSVAFGEDTEASGDHGSTAFGTGSIASGDYGSTAFGSWTEASGESSAAFNIATIASGSYSTAFGNTTRASGMTATAFGQSNTASGYISTVFGHGMTVSGDYSFGVNVGTPSSPALSQANTIALMGGNVGIGTTSPQYRLTVAGDFAVTGTIRVGNAMASGTYGQLLMSTATSAAWISTSSLGLGTGNLSGSGTATQVAFFTDTNTLSSSSSLYWDNTNGRLGIGTSSPPLKLTLDATVASGGQDGFGIYGGNSTTAILGNVNSAGTYTGVMALYRSDYWGPTTIISGGGSVSLYGFHIGTSTYPIMTPSLFTVGSSLEFRISSDGDITRINDVPMSWPSSQGGVGTILQNDGSGNLSWEATSSLGLIDGAGSPGFVSFWNSSTTLSYDDEGLYWDGMDNRLGIGTTTPSMTLDVYGNINIPQTNGTTRGGIYMNGSRYIYSSSTGDSLFVGNLAGNFSMSGASNTAIGTYALRDNVSGYQNVAIGSGALPRSGNYTTAIGAGALANSYDVHGSIAIGAGAMFSNTTSDSNLAIGISSLYENIDGEYNIAVGNSALLSNISGDFNTAVGYSSMYFNTSSNYNTAYGYRSLCSNTAGTRNIGVGPNALEDNTTGYDNVAVGYNALNANISGYWDVSIGSYSMNQKISGIGNVGIGQSTLRNMDTGSYNTAVGIGTLYNANTSSYSTAIGAYSMYGITGTTSLYNIGVGVESLYKPKGSYNIGIGYQALYNNANYDGSNNIAIGNDALWAGASANDNIAIGRSAMRYSTGIGNIAIGANIILNGGVSGGARNVLVGYGVGPSGYSLEGGDNVFIGAYANVMTSTVTGAVAIGRSALVADDYNIAIGYKAWATTTNSMAIGYGAKATAINSAAIGQGAYASVLNAFVIGTSTSYVGIGTSAPSTSLHVVETGDVVATFDRQTNDGIIIDFLQGATKEGAISVSGNTITYGAFTGSHYALISNPSENIERGHLVTMTGTDSYLHNNSNSEILYGITKTTIANDPKVIGSFLALEELSKPAGVENPYLVMAVGNGDVWIIDTGETINAGDYLISSDIAGHAMKDTGEYDVSYIFARAAEDVEWSGITDMVDGVKHKKISVFFESFARDNQWAKSFNINTASSTLTVKTPTLAFTTTTYFTSSITSTPDSRAFIFNALNFDTTSTDKYILSLRSNNNPVFSVSSNGDVHSSGNMYAASAVLGTSTNPGDLAERVDINPTETVEAGDVMMVDPASPDRYQKSNQAYEPTVAGVISTNPTIIVGNGKTDQTAPLAMVGRVPVKFSEENGPIQRGDLLVSASTPGYAMKYDPILDNSRKVVGIIGIALDNSMESTNGKVMTLIRTGWVYNRTQAVSNLEQQVYYVASSAGVDLSVDPELMNVETTSEGSITYNSDSNLSLNNFSITNVKSIISTNNKWTIDENGILISKIITSEGTEKNIYGMTSESAEITLSGSAELTNGEAVIVFATDTQWLIDETQEIKVIPALTSGDCNGIFVSEKSSAGFTIKELSGGTSTSTFDWLVIAKRKMNIQDEIIYEPTPTPPIDDTPTTTPLVDSPTTTPPIDTSTSIPPTSTPPIDPPTTTPSIEIPLVEEPVGPTS